MLKLTFQDAEGLTEVYGVELRKVTEHRWLVKNRSGTWDRYYGNLISFEEV